MLYKGTLCTGLRSSLFRCVTTKMFLNSVLSVIECARKGTGRLKRSRRPGHPARRGRLGRPGRGRSGRGRPGRPLGRPRRDPLEERANECLECPRCNSSYRHKSSLDRHLQYECGVEPRFQCYLCGRRFNYKRPLETHIRKVHNVDW